MTKTITVSEETYEKIKDQILEEEKVDISYLEDLVDKKWYFRTVTYHLIGKVEKIVGNFAELSNASWVADSGRFMNTIKDGSLDEVEPVGVAYINIQSLVDFFPWNHNLPKEQK